jgi:general bacterial porin, GBP family
MKKSLIALAVLGAMSGAAFAQSSVTVYGIVDIGLQWNKQGQALPGATGATQESGFTIDSGNQSGSRLGFRGSEALGRNWNAVFTLEAGFEADQGISGQGGRLFGRQVWGGLQHNQIGTFAMGRIATSSSGTGSFDLFGAVDPFGTGFGPIGLQATFIPSNSLRENNSIIWASPSWAGFKFAAQYSFDIPGNDTQPSGRNTTGMNFGANWTWGPLFVAATYDVINFSNCYGTSVNNVCTTAGNGPAAGNPDQKMLQLGATFDLKFLKIHGAYADQKNISTVGTVAANNPISASYITFPLGYYNNQAYMFGLSAPLFGGSIFGSYQWSDAKNIISNLAQFEPDFNVWGIGYTYPFSRRTNMYAAYGIRSWDGSIRTTTGTLLSTTAQAFDRDYFVLGIRHLF